MVAGRELLAVSKLNCAGWRAVLVGTYYSPDVYECSHAPGERHTVLALLYRNVVQDVENVLGQLCGGLVAEFRVLRNRLRDELHALFVDGNVRTGLRHHRCLSWGGARRRSARGRSVRRPTRRSRAGRRCPRCSRSRSPLPKRGARPVGRFPAAPPTASTPDRKSVV